MRELSVFDIIGPIMIGPSSSHTAGALKIARVARMLAKTKIVSAHFQLYGSFATTYKGHGTDRALVGGILGFETDDYRIRESFQLAKEAGIEIIFMEMEMETDTNMHPNTVDIIVTEEDGTVSSLRGASVGGGEIEITRINGCEIKFSGKNNAVIIQQIDRPGVLASITKVFEVFDVNISSMSVFSKEKGGAAFSVLEIDGHLPEVGMEALLRQPNIVSAVYIKVK
ncbi:MAG: L-serine ammonia-lyase, iron-sulfur-dependent subunit beta [Clostridia bacterium]|nr:L-serine ammonia-lyase, iron-sulfur-dependent subunit beta [Clostridia bacterium]